MVLYMKSKKHCFCWCVLLQLICPSLWPCYLYSTMLFKHFLFIDNVYFGWFSPRPVDRIFFLNWIPFYFILEVRQGLYLFYPLISSLFLQTTMIPLHLMSNESLTFVLILVINKHKIHKHPKKTQQDSYLNCYNYYIIWLQRWGI